MPGLATLLELVQKLLDIEAQIEGYLKGISDEKRRTAIRDAIMRRDIDALNKLILD